MGILYPLNIIAVILLTVLSSYMNNYHFINNLSNNSWSICVRIVFYKNKNVLVPLPREKCLWRSWHGYKKIDKKSKRFTWTAHVHTFKSCCILFKF